jgi:hypothetical protein
VSCSTTSVRPMRRPLPRCLNRLGTPRDPEAPALDAVAGKGFEPEVMLRKLQSLLTGVPYEELSEAELVAMEGEDGPWIVQLSEELRDALADAQASRLPVVVERWVRTEEFWDQATATEVLPFLDEVTALAGRARQAGERLYCGSACSGRSARRHRGCRSTWVRGGALLDRGGSLSVRLGAEAAVGERKALPAGRMRLAEGHIPWPRRAPCWAGYKPPTLAVPGAGRPSTGEPVSGDMDGDAVGNATRARWRQQAVPRVRPLRRNRPAHTEAGASLEAPAIVRSGWPTPVTTRSRGRSRSRCPGGSPPRVPARRRSRGPRGFGPW